MPTRALPSPVSSLRSLSGSKRALWNSLLGPTCLGGPAEEPPLSFAARRLRPRAADLAVSLLQLSRCEHLWSSGYDVSLTR